MISLEQENLTVEDIIKLCHIKSKFARQTVNTWCIRGEFPGAFKAAHQWLIPREAYQKFKLRRAA